MKRLVVIALVGLGLIVSTAAYMRETEEVRIPVRFETRCSDTRHQGDTLFRTETREMTTTRWDARVGAHVEYGLCPACLKRVKEEERITKARAGKAEREAKAKAEADRLMQNLEIHFHAVLLDYAQAVQWNYDLPTQKLKVGDRIAFVFFFKNTGQEPISDGTVRAIVRPTNNLIYGPYGANIYDLSMRQEAAASKGVLRQLATKGLPVPKILPYNNPYYASENTVCKFEIADLNDLDRSLPFGNWLAVGPKAKPGQSIQFSGYIAFRGHEVAVGTSSVNIIYNQ